MVQLCFHSSVSTLEDPGGRLSGQSEDFTSEIGTCQVYNTDGKNVASLVSISLVKSSHKSDYLFEKTMEHEQARNSSTKRRPTVDYLAVNDRNLILAQHQFCLLTLNRIVRKQNVLFNGYVHYFCKKEELGWGNRISFLNMQLFNSVHKSS